ncbi:ATP-binding protein [Fructilactobacillus sanfranciscensis]|uniref:ATP-binding protein n=1 Tax=Fructilactobacillus sanfranciscensis TaxID=1625 RepID=UPI0013D7F2E3|nr:ATP-binding protein [Fructilactobacillus sanfranciscensis]NDR97399.1 ATP-binding protein [Fructilactobacillus sanfranciscensis]
MKTSVSNSLSEFAPIKLKETCSKHPDVHLIKSRIPNHEDIVCPKCVEELIKEKDKKLAERMNDRFTVERLANDSIITDQDILNCTFGNYIVTKSEQDINKNHITAIAKKYLNKAYKGNTILSGNAGSGKTHLAYACLKFVNENSNPKQSCLFIDFNELVSKIKGNFGNKSSKWQETKLLDEIGNADLVVLDDLGSEASFKANSSESSEWNQRFLFNILNRRNRTIITTNLSGAELKEVYNAKIVSRITKGAKDNILKFKETSDKRSSMYDF